MKQEMLYHSIIQYFQKPNLIINFIIYELIIIIVLIIRSYI